MLKNPELQFLGPSRSTQENLPTPADPFRVPQYTVYLYIYICIPQNPAIISKYKALRFLLGYGFHALLPQESLITSAVFGGMVVGAPIWGRARLISLGTRRAPGVWGFWSGPAPYCKGLYCRSKMLVHLLLTRRLISEGHRIPKALQIVEHIYGF